MRIALGISALLLVMAACGGGDDAADVDSVLSITDAAEASPGDLATVRGFIVADAEGTRLCEALAESFPPQCGGNFLILEEFDTGAFSQIFTQEGDVTWTDEAQDVVGFLEAGGVIRVQGLAGDSQETAE